MNSQQLMFLQPRTTLEAMRLERQRLDAEKQKSKARMNKSVQQLLKRPNSSTDRFGSFMNLAQNALAIYQGIRMGASFITAVRRSFGHK